MLDTPDNTGGSPFGNLDDTLDVPAISLQLATTIGGTRSLTLTTGLPLDCTSEKLNGLLDKLTAASDRQKKRYDLEQTRMLLKNEEQNLHQHRTQAGVQETIFDREWNASARKGDRKLTASQQNTLNGLQKNIENSVERIKQLRAGIAEAEKECL